MNLADLAESLVCRELPSGGLLSVFYDSEGDVYGSADGGGWEVRYSPDAARLIRHEPPNTLVRHARFRAAELTFAEMLTLPTLDSPWEGELALSDDEQADYRELLAEPGLGHRLLGYAHSLQNDVHGSKSFRHLLTIDSEDATGWGWGDTGLLYFTIQQNHLERHQFDQVEFEMQCC